MPFVKNLLLNDYFILLIKISVLFLITLFAWHQSHFQFQEYWEEPYKTFTYYFMVMIVIIIALIALLKKYPSKIIYFVGGYILILLFCGGLQNIFYEESLLPYLKTIALLICSLLILKSKQNLMIFIWINFSLGMFLILLNMVTIAHWVNIFELPYEQISRVGGSVTQGHLNPISFGIFGRAESYYQGGEIIPRLQGFSSEPLHWGYFVLLTFSMGMLLCSEKGNKIKFLLSLCFVIILIHTYFLKSTTIYISFIAAACSFVVMLTIFNLKKIKKYKKFLVFSMVVLIPGLILPFALALLPNIDQLFSTEQLFGEGGNWKGKIDFLHMGNDLFTIALPSINAYVPISHNLILDFYIKFGFLLLIPLLLALLEFLNISITNNKYSNLAVLTFFVTLTLAHPDTIFLPSGALWAAIIFGYIYHKNLSENDK